MADEMRCLAACRPDGSRTKRIQWENHGFFDTEEASSNYDFDRVERLAMDWFARSHSEPIGMLHIVVGY